MRKIQKSALVPYTVAQMFALVDDIDSYADFLPWCSKSVVMARSIDIVEAELTISYGQMNKTFTTRNINTPDSSIEMQLIEGPFKHLNGHWEFVMLGNEGCKVSLDLSFEFSNKLLDMTIGPVFSQIANSLVDAFTERAGKVYG
jgi:ribosome-associated toxin RatA of RatAB toxin-antitoxin module